MGTNALETMGQKKECYMTLINDLHIHERRMMEDMINPTIDEILRGEISAVEAYNQVLEKIELDPEIIRLEQFRDQHLHAVNYWQRQAKREGKIPEKSSSVWGTVVEAFVGVSKLLGHDAALKALKAGEEHGLKNYEDLLEDRNLTPMQKREIEECFIPRQISHIESIEAILKTH